METPDSPLSPETLAADFLSRGRFYKKGFGILIQGMINDLDIMQEKSDKEPHVNSLREQARRMREIYDEMLSEGMQDSPDADLLMFINQKINALIVEMENVILTGSPPDEAFKILKSIFRKAQELRARLRNLQKQLNALPGYERIRIGGKDIFGGEWSSFHV